METLWNTPGTRGGPGGRERTLAEKKEKKGRKSDFLAIFRLFMASVRSRPPGPPLVPGVFFTSLSHVASIKASYIKKHIEGLGQKQKSKGESLVQNVSRPPCTTTHLPTDKPCRLTSNGSLVPVQVLVISPRSN